MVAFCCSSQRLSTIFPVRLRECGSTERKLISLMPSCKGIEEKFGIIPFTAPLYEFERQRLTQFLMGTIHVPYGMMDAFRSAGIGLSYFELLLHGTDLHRIFCSEWGAAALSYCGVWPTTNFGRWNPNKLLRHLRIHGVLCRSRRLK